MNDRPSSWGYGAGLGMVAVGLLVYGDAQAGHLNPMWWAVYPSVFVACVGGVLTLAGAGQALAWGLREYDEWLERRRPAVADEDETDAYESQPVTHVSLVNDLTDAERYVQDGLRLTLEHGRRAGGLTWERIGHAFPNTRTWVWWTGILAQSRLAEKSNGQPTVLPPGKTYAWALRQVRQGYFEMPELDDHTTLPPQPAPLGPEAVEKAKVEKAIKAV